MHQLVSKYATHKGGYKQLYKKSVSWEAGQLRKVIYTTVSRRIQYSSRAANRREFTRKAAGAANVVQFTAHYVRTNSQAHRRKYTQTDRHLLVLTPLVYFKHFDVFLSTPPRECSSLTSTNTD